jgi:hypothetical protein
VRRRELSGCGREAAARDGTLFVEIEHGLATLSDEQAGAIAILSPANLDWLRRFAVSHSFHVVEMERVHDRVTGRCFARTVEAIEVSRVSIVLEDNREAPARRVSLKYCLLAGRCSILVTVVTPRA